MARYAPMLRLHGKSDKVALFVGEGVFKLLINRAIYTPFVFCGEDFKAFVAVQAT